MATIPCPDCGKTVSDRAQTCPNCSCPIAQVLAESSQRSGCLATLWSLPVAFFHGFTGEFFSKCPDCRKHVDPQAKRCPHCGKWFNR